MRRPGIPRGINGYGDVLYDTYAIEMIGWATVAGHSVWLWNFSIKHGGESHGHNTHIFALETKLMGITLFVCYLITELPILGLQILISSSNA